ncbi:hypothetical protein Nepgr_020281 [Nepenthes gracilis]|uniref:Uncharacterized protein n=1 Tax=Nepenthes gracilis TaxID=150966 RepID=A0AAD3SV46_NEPGR|nr:hypothetical protein Nepgr_020281 [Nepenthes gracilis]
MVTVATLGKRSRDLFCNGVRIEGTSVARRFSPIPSSTESSGDSSDRSFEAAETAVRVATNDLPPIASGAVLISAQKEPPASTENISDGMFTTGLREAADPQRGGAQEPQVESSAQEPQATTPFCGPGETFPLKYAYRPPAQPGIFRPEWDVQTSDSLFQGDTDIVEELTRGTLLPTDASLLQGMLTEPLADLCLGSLIRGVAAARVICDRMTCYGREMQRLGSTRGRPDVEAALQMQLTQCQLEKEALRRKAEEAQQRAEALVVRAEEAERAAADIIPTLLSKFECGFKSCRDLIARLNPGVPLGRLDLRNIRVKDVSEMLDYSVIGDFGTERPSLARDDNAT